MYSETSMTFSLCLAELLNVPFSYAKKTHPEDFVFDAGPILLVRKKLRAHVASSALSIAVTGLELVPRLPNELCERRLLTCLLRNRQTTVGSRSSQNSDPRLNVARHVIEGRGNARAIPYSGAVQALSSLRCFNGSCEYIATSHG